MTLAKSVILSGRYCTKINKWRGICITTQAKKLSAMLRKGLILFLAMSFALSAFSQSKLATDVGALLKSGNAKDLAAVFTGNITLSVNDNEDVYSRAQAELVVKEFFAKNKPSAFRIIHNGTSKTGMEYIIGNMDTATGQKRVSYYISVTADKALVKELRIEESDDE